MKDIVLPGTSLCAIIRDEIINPAGGIKRFLASVMPHVERAVIVDTGSIDGTREILEEAKKDFPHLEIYDSKFEGYAEARNFSLSKSRTDRALILDADELILQEDYVRLRREIESNSNHNISLLFKDALEICDVPSDGFNPRLVMNNINLKLVGRPGHHWHWEEFEGKRYLKIHECGVPIYHFKTSSGAYQIKYDNWYDSPTVPDFAPSQAGSFIKWKKFNPRRNNYKGSNLDNPEDFSIAA